MLKRLIKRLFWYLGYDVRRLKPAVRISMETALAQVKNMGFYPSVIIDVGVGNGTPALTLVFPKSRYLWIEPLIEFEPVLKKLSQKYSGDYLLAAAGRSCGRATIHVHTVHTEGSSVFRESDGQIADGQPREIPMVSLDSVRDKWKLSDDLLLKVDVQGAELEVLKGAQTILPGCEVIILEVSLFECLQGAPLFDEIFVYMKQQGFVVYDMVEGHNRPLDGALAQKDIVFVKERGRFRTTQRWASDELRQKLSGYCLSL